MEERTECYVDLRKKKCVKYSLTSANDASECDEQSRKLDLVTFYSFKSCDQQDVLTTSNDRRLYLVIRSM